MLSAVEQSERQVQGLFIGCIFVSVALFVVVYIDFIKQVAKNNFVEWDVKTVTAGDYTIEFDIEAEFWEKFLAQHGSSKPVGSTMIVHFRKWITKEMEKKLSALPDLGFEDHPVTNVHIAATNFAFDNADLINLLKARGEAITADDFDKMRTIDKQINELKKTNLANLTRPVSVFMTFENEEGVQRALQFEDREMKPDDSTEFKEMYQWLGDQTIEIQQASEPSDIIWENRHFTPAQRFKKGIIVSFIIGLALLASFVVVFISR